MIWRRPGQSAFKIVENTGANSVVTELIFAYHEIGGNLKYFSEFPPCELFSMHDSDIYMDQFNSIFD